MLDCVTLKIRLEHPDIQPDLALLLAVQAGNDTTNENGLCPMLLVVGVLPKIPDEVLLLPHQQDRVRAMHLARREFQRLVTRSRVALGQRLRPPASSLHNLRPGQMIYVYRERIRRWIGPVCCAYRQGKHILVSIGCALKAFNLSQCRPAPIPTRITLHLPVHPICPVLFLQPNLHQHQHNHLQGQEHLVRRNNSTRLIHQIQKRTQKIPTLPHTHRISWNLGGYGPGRQGKHFEVISVRFPKSLTAGCCSCKARFRIVRRACGIKRSGQ
jgi:hypothetical protein